MLVNRECECKMVRGVSEVVCACVVRGEVITGLSVVCECVVEGGIIVGV